MKADSPVTELLGSWSDGNDSALEKLAPLVYDHLHQIASRHLRKERPDHTLQATALINEAYVALVGNEVEWNDRLHFFAVASNVMRRILIDHARSAQRQKRGGDALHVTLHEDVVADGHDTMSVLDLDAVLEKLTEADERKGQIVEMHYFGGLTYDDIAAVLKVSPATVKRELRFSKAWLRRKLGEGHWTD